MAQARRDSAVQIAVHTLGQEPTHVETTLAPEELDLADEPADFDQPVHVQLKLTRMQEDVLAEGQTRTTARIACSRCLEPVALAIDGSFRSLFVPEEGAYGERMGRQDFEWDDERVAFYTEGTIDLSDEICQSLVIELPLKPLCSPDCAGLCPQCGKDLNEGPCDCEPEPEPEEAPSPWDALRDIVQGNE
ncbi:MAG: YceD family protein [Planctomycetota bacterium]